jgi:putative toxin-antitoxin system antitoxin component (TIGR02293 family)
MNTQNLVHNLRLEFGFSYEDMGHMIGVTGKTVTRWEKEKNKLQLLASQRIVELEALSKKMDGVIKKEKKNEWLKTPNEELDNKTPLYVIEQGSTGIQEVIQLLGRIKWGIST